MGGDSGPGNEAVVPRGRGEVRKNCDAAQRLALRMLRSFSGVLTGSCAFRGDAGWHESG